VLKLPEPELALDADTLKPTTTITIELPLVLYPVGFVTVMLPPDEVFVDQVIPAAAPPVELIMIPLLLLFAVIVTFVPASRYRVSLLLLADK
jgi:hypothetical protein